MPKQNKYTHYKLQQASRQTLNVNRFLGVDYSTQKFLISEGRAIDLKNFIYRDGIIQKRHGFEQILKVKDFEYVPSSFDDPTAPAEFTVYTNQNAKEINGIWSFEAEDGEIHIVAHIGCLMYEIVNLDNDNIEAEPIVNGQTTVAGQPRFLAFKFENYKSSAFVGGNKLWFLGGNKYMCLRFVDTGVSKQTIFFAVEDSSLAPIPTTTIGITYKNAVAGSRSSLDKANLLTKWRKNQLVSGVTKQEDEDTKTMFFEYTLDAPIIPEGEIDMANLTVTIEERGEIE